MASESEEIPKSPYRKPDVGDEVVITGVSGKFPYSHNIYHFRDNLFNKVDLISHEFSKWKSVNPDIPRRTGKLFNIEKFDAGCFGATSTQSNYMDPASRILLEMTNEAISDAGYHPSDFEGSNTGVFMGFSISETEIHEMFNELTPAAEIITGTHRSMIARRISYSLKVKGPVVQTDTACSSSLYALNQAYHYMRAGKCDRAIVCGAQLCFHPLVSLQFKRLGVLSPSDVGRCFDADSDGYVRAEAIVVFILEKAKDAKRIYSEVVYAKVNCDGYKREGISYPSAKMQNVLMKELYAECGIDPTTLTFVEAHATGTLVGDLEELEGLDDVMCTGRDRLLYIGSVKSNIGHSEAAAGLCSVTKALICMETGFIPPNLNYNKPREGMNGLLEGRMKVVTEKMPLPDDRGWFACNGFGFGGANAHVLLRWNSKAKINGGQPKDDLPRLICVSSRVEDGVNSILDDYEGRACDAEFAYLIHQAFRKSVPNHLYRGYAIYNKHREIKRALRGAKLEVEKLYLVFSDFDEEWFKLSDHLMKIPAFAENMNSIKKVISELVDLDISKVIRNSIEMNLIDEILATVAVQITLAHTLKELNLLPDHLIGFGTGELVAAYLDNYLTLKQTILALFYLASASVNKRNNKEDLKNLETVLSSNSKTWEKWIPVHAEKFSNCRKYFEDNFNEVPNEITLKKLIPGDAFTLIIGSTITSFHDNASYLINFDSKNHILDFFTNLGSIYLSGFDMELNKLYPTVELPVSRGTPMLSPLIKWNHKDWNVYEYKNETHNRKGHIVFEIKAKNDEWNFILGHVIDGRTLFPATGFLFLAWESFAILTGKLSSEMRIVFEDVKYIRACNVPIDGAIELVIAIQTASQKFEITEKGVVLVTGTIYEKTTEDTPVNIPGICSSDGQLTMTENDVYKELRLRGYHYAGKFRGIKRCSVDVTSSIIEWEDNWTTFMDSMIQLGLLQRDTRSIFIPTSIDRIVVDAPKHIAFAKTMKDNMLPVYANKDVGIFISGGVEINGLGPNAINRKKAPEPVLEISKFIPNDARLEFQISIRALVQTVLENSNTLKVKVIESCTEEQDEDYLLSPVVQASLTNTPLVQQDIEVLTSKVMDISGVAVVNKPLSMESHCLILIVKNLLETTDISVALNVIKEAKGFVITRESSNVDLSKFSNSPFMVICSHILQNETLVLLRPNAREMRDTKFLDLSKAIDNLENWIPKLQDLLKETSKVVLYAQDEELSGILGLVTCLKCESYGDRISCVLIVDKAPKFDPKLPFYKDQLEKNMAINVWKDGSWGTYRHLPLPETNLVENEHCYANFTARGDLSTQTWVEGKLSAEDPVSYENKNTYIYYSALNFRDLMLASAKLPLDAITSDRMEQECVQGLEFVGRNSKGERVMGIYNNGALGTLINSRHILPIPDHWTMEEAATVLVTYGTVLEILFSNFDVKPGESILIHSATGGVGLSAINLCLYFGLTIFATVGTEEKYDFLRKHYPQIEEHHIGNSRDTSFEDMIRKHTNGRGVDYVLNSLAEEKLLASVRCLTKGGKFLEIGKFDLSRNNALDLHLLERQAQFVEMGFDIDEKFDKLRGKIDDLLKRGAITPLPRTVFEMDDLEKAFRFMTTGTHIGKVLIKIREEESAKVCLTPRRLFKGVPRFYCKPECSYVIYGGLGGFGMELADFMVMRGAKKLLLTSRSGISNGYQRYRISNWKKYGATVVIATHDASTEEGCTELLNLANELGPVDGIFNLAVVLKDELFENHTVEDFKTALLPKAHCTINFDRISRKLCPSLRYFVVFSSVSCGRGNTGQTNYGMGNSVMERICEKRKRDGYPALAIQWGVIGEVGLLAKMQEDRREFSIGGTLQQRISSCLQVMDQFLRQDEPIVASMVVAEKRSGGKANNLFEEIIDILGIINIKSVSMHATLPEMGMDSMAAIEIKQILEREYEIFLTAQDIKSMTLARLKELSKGQDSSAKAGAPVDQKTLPMDLQLLLRYVGNEEFSNVPVITMKTMLTGKNVDRAPHIIVLPGVEGMAPALEPLCNKLKARVSCIQYSIDSRAETITQLAKCLIPHIEGCGSKDSIIVAYSFGTVVAAEVLPILESKGWNTKVIFIDGSPDLLTSMAQAYFPANNENLFQILLLSGIMMKYASYEEILKHQETLMKLDRYEEKLDYLMSAGPKVDLSNRYITDMCISFYDKLKGLFEYRIAEVKLRSKVTLFKAKTALSLNATADYGLSKICQENVEVHTVEGNHVTILENDDLAMKINEILDK